MLLFEEGGKENEMKRIALLTLFGCVSL